MNKDDLANDLSHDLSNGSAKRDNKLCEKYVTKKLFNKVSLELFYLLI